MNSFSWLLASRVTRSIGIMFVTLSSSLYLSALGLVPVQVGLVFLGVTAYIAGFSMGMGMLGDRIGYRTVLVIADVMPAAAILALALSRSVDVVIPAVIIAGLGGTAGGARGAFSPGLTALIARNWRDERERVEKMGKVTSASSLAGVGGGVLLSLHDYMPFGNINDYRVLFALASVLLIASASFLLRVEERKGERKTTRFMRRASLNYISRVVLSNTLSGAGLGLAIPLLPLWFKLRFGATPTEIGIIFSLSGLFTALGSLSATRIRFDPLKVASFTRLMNGLLLVTMAFSPLLPLAGGLYVMRGLNAGMGMPNRTAVNVRGVSEEDFGTASSLQGVATRLSQTTSGLSGYLMEEGVYLPLEIGGLLQMLGGVVYYLALESRARGVDGRGREGRTVEPGQK
ncbi:arabinose efflux permease family protein [Metallosphaera yellowstonensis MK1]|uniref:Arabinose efflux permease family protein n=1 Tax=Metallosphaera yellowstonensis MK1 TaxID=671065 RepID=H2C790_9CREN|nr:MFS transporter [Metallosphaera yellowstonensis]EHP68016.1 arabinose efflux permease family protein [Metallosphaera yellowstonensis MK1]